MRRDVTLDVADETGRCEHGPSRSVDLVWKRPIEACASAARISARCSGSFLFRMLQKCPVELLFCSEAPVQDSG